MTDMWGGLVCRVTQGSFLVFVFFLGGGGGDGIGGVRQTRNLYLCVARCVSELPGAVNSSFHRCEMHFVTPVLKCKISGHFTGVCSNRPQKTPAKCIEDITSRYNGNFCLSVHLEIWALKRKSIHG